MKLLARTGAKGEPMAARSFCLSNLPLKKESEM